VVRIIPRSAEASNQKEEQSWNASLSFDEYFKKINSTNILSRGSEVTLAEVVKNFSEVCTKHGFSDNAAKDVAGLLNCLVPESKLFPRHDFLAPASNFTPASEFAVNRYCATCVEWLDGPNNFCTSCKEFKKEEKSEVGYYILNDLEVLLKDLFENRGLAEVLDQQKFPREGGGDLLLRDVTDGVRYKTLPRTSKYDISFIYGAVVPFIISDDPEKLFVANMLTIAELEPAVREDFLLLANISVWPKTLITNAR